MLGLKSENVYEGPRCSFKIEISDASRRSGPGALPSGGLMGAQWGPTVHSVMTSLATRKKMKTGVLTRKKLATVDSFIYWDRHYHCDCTGPQIADLSFTHRVVNRGFDHFFS